MGGGHQPYIYEPTRQAECDPSQHDFDPKAFTRASWAPAPAPKPKPEGPLLDFNRHPDSYLVLPYGKTNAKPLSPRTKAAIKGVRWVQLAMRILQTLGAIGLLICVICIKGAQDSEGLIMKIPPGVDIMTNCYAIYHLVRPAKARTPTSSASYHFFALIMDAGFIPFYVSTFLMARDNWGYAPGTDGRWRTFFSSDETTTLLLLVTWLAGIVMAAFHLISACLCVFLVVVFRKIARMPPDMNPLEDNLTSRRAAKHKHKNSSISVMTNEKRFSDLTGSTVNIPNPGRMSHADAPLLPHADVHKISFFHTRTNSNDNFSPHTPSSAAHARAARASWAESISQAEHNRRSQGSLSPSPTKGYDSPRHSYLGPNPGDSARHSLLAPLPTKSPRHSFVASSDSPRNSFLPPSPRKDTDNRRNSFLDPASAADGSSKYSSRPSTAVSSFHDHSQSHHQSGEASLVPSPLEPPPKVSAVEVVDFAEDIDLAAPQVQRRSELQSDNWFVMGGTSDDLYDSIDSTYQPQYQLSLTPEDASEVSESHYDDELEDRPAPLAMHPPTLPPATPPKMANTNRYHATLAEPEARGRASRLSAVSHHTLNSETPSFTSTIDDPRLRMRNSGDSPSPSPPKRRQYGDLAAATRGIRASRSPQPPPHSNNIELEEPHRRSEYREASPAPAIAYTRNGNGRRDPSPHDSAYGMSSTGLAKSRTRSKSRPRTAHSRSGSRGDNATKRQSILAAMAGGPDRSGNAGFSPPGSGRKEQNRKSWADVGSEKRKSWAELGRPGRNPYGFGNGNWATEEREREREALHRSMESQGASGYGRTEGSPRVVSRSGVDYPRVDVDVHGMGDLGLGMYGRRDVSGKVAEEGRGGLNMGMWGTVRRRVSGMT